LESWNGSIYGNAGFETMARAYFPPGTATMIFDHENAPGVGPQTTWAAIFKI
jgi:hypothetical protein